MFLVGDKSSSVPEMTAYVQELKEVVDANTLAAAEKGLKTAESHRRAGRTDSARSYYKLICRRYPDTVVERVGILGFLYSLVELKDGSLLSNDGRLSRDGGKSWTAPCSFGMGVTGTGLLRLASGALVLVSPVGYGEGKLWLSRDEGKTWKLAGPIVVPGGPVFELGDTLIQLANGRLLYCWDYNMVGDHPGMEYATVSAYGTWKGKRYQIEGHGHRPCTTVIGGPRFAPAGDHDHLCRTWHSVLTLRGSHERDE